jgi:hypothetical protein
MACAVEFRESARDGTENGACAEANASKRPRLLKEVPHEIPRAGDNGWGTPFAIVTVCALP